MVKIRIVDHDGKRYTWTEWWKQGVADDYGLAARLGALRRDGSKGGEQDDVR